jgi:dephospho-CoA kinase
MGMIHHIGLTGGIGSGKSTVASLLAECGAAVIDADAISRSLTAPGGLALQAIAHYFGAEMITPEGAMDRVAMRARVFHDPQAKQQLERIIHPLVGQVTQAQTLQAIDSGKTCLVFDVPLLVESGTRWRQRVQHVLVVDCEEATQIERVVHRSALNPAEVQRIIDHQASRIQRLACADSVIYNQGIHLQGLKREVNLWALRFGL